jgi:hypothetical protein
MSGDAHSYCFSPARDPEGGSSYGGHDPCDRQGLLAEEALLFRPRGGNPVFQLRQIVRNQNQAGCRGPLFHGHDPSDRRVLFRIATQPIHGLGRISDYPTRLNDPDRVTKFELYGSIHGSQADSIKKIRVLRCRP